MNTTDDHAADDTVEISLTDELLAPAAADPGCSSDSDETTLEQTSPLETGDDPKDADRAGVAGDDDYLELDNHRSRWTTGLVVALIFVLGVFCGVLLTRGLSPSPPPQTVYVLNDQSGSGSSAPPVPSGQSLPPMPSDAPSAPPSVR